MTTAERTMMIDFRNMDCMELMAEFEDNHFDLAIVDPPYGIGMGTKINSITGGVKHTPKNWDENTPEKKYFDELQRVSKNQIVWGGNYFATMLPNTACWIVWDKNNGASKFADGELAWTSFSSPVRIKEVHWCGSSALHETRANKIHPCQKPVKLYNWLLKEYAKEGYEILDTHVGSGSSIISCKNSGFDIVGCELDEEYYKLAQQRIKEETAQLSLF
jgi:site-specific DNA-methyltransferase (adenine-specific)